MDSSQIPRLLPIRPDGTNRQQVMELLTAWVNQVNLSPGTAVKYRNSNYWWQGYNGVMVELKKCPSVGSPKMLEVGLEYFYMHALWNDTKLVEVDWKGNGVPVYAEHWLVMGTPNRVSRLCKLWAKFSSLVPLPNMAGTDEEKEWRLLINEAKGIITEPRPFNSAYVIDLFDGHLAKLNYTYQELLDKLKHSLARDELEKAAMLPQNG